MGIEELGVRNWELELGNVCRDASTIPINIKDRLLTRLAMVQSSVFSVQCSVFKN